MASENSNDGEASDTRRNLHTTIFERLCRTVVADHPVAVCICVRPSSVRGRMIVTTWDSGGDSAAHIEAVLAMSESKYTPERRAAFVRAVDEFGEDDPGAYGERTEELVDALDAEARTWDEGPDAPPVALEVETVEPPTSERVTRTG